MDPASCRLAERHPAVGEGEGGIAVEHRARRRQRRPSNLPTHAWSMIGQLRAARVRPTDGRRGHRKTNCQLRRPPEPTSTADGSGAHASKRGRRDACATGPPRPTSGSEQGVAGHPGAGNATQDASGCDTADKTHPCSKSALPQLGESRHRDGGGQGLTMASERGGHRCIACKETD